MKKISNPIREGLPSKIYLKAYPKTISRYQIAKELYAIEKGHIPPTAKVSNQARVLINLGYVTETETKDGIISNTEPLLKEIEKELETKNIPALTTQERKELYNFLDMEFRLLIEKKRNGGDMNAYSELTKQLGGIVFIKDLFNSVRDRKQREMLLQILTLENVVDKKMAMINSVKLSQSILDKLFVFVPEYLRPLKTLIHQITPSIAKELIRGI